MTAVQAHLPAARTTGAIPGLLLAGLAACLLYGAVSAPADAVTWGALALAAWCAALLAVVSAAGHTLAQWKIGPWLLAWCAVTSGLATLAWSPSEAGTGSQITAGSILRALCLIAVAMTAWSAGYIAGPRALAEPYAARAIGRLGARLTGDIRSPAVPWVLYAVGTAARLVSAVTTGHLGYVGDAASAVTSASSYQQVLSLAAFCAPLAIAVAALRAFRERAPGAGLTLAVLLAAEITYGALAGGKQGFVLAVLAVALPLTAARRKVPKAILTLGVIAFLALVIPFNAAYRSAARGGDTVLTTGQAASGAPAILRDVTRSVSPAVIGQSVTYLAQRVQEIDSPAIIMQRTPAQFPYSSPAQLAEAPVIDLVPRAIWHGKPVLTTGYQFSQQYYGLPPSVYSSSAITPAGDLYRHGGWLPVLAGMFLLGLMVRILDDVLDVRRNPHALLLVLLLFPVLVKAEDDWITMLAGIPGLLLAWYLVVRFSFARRTAPVQ